MSLKKLIAFDEADLAILSAHVQDAALSAADMAYLPQEQRFAFVATRYVREEGEDTRRRPVGMHFERVTHVRAAGVTPGSDEKLQLLAVHFLPKAAPSGTVQMIFAGGGEIRLEVECLESAMSDLEEGETCACPQHALG